MEGEGVGAEWLPRVWAITGTAEYESYIRYSQGSFWP
jgi:hypothetical protein